MAKKKWVDPGRPRRGDILRLVKRLPTEKEYVEAYPCFSRLNKDYSSSRIWMRDGMRLMITCACHPGERRATYNIRYKLQQGYPSYSTLSFKETEIELEEFRSTHSVVKARVTRVIPRKPRR